jgi:hypothetical protein
VNAGRWRATRTIVETFQASGLKPARATVYTAHANSEPMHCKKTARTQQQSSPNLDDSSYELPRGSPEEFRKVLLGAAYLAS